MTLGFQVVIEHPHLHIVKHASLISGIYLICKSNKLNMYIFVKNKLYYL